MKKTGLFSLGIWVFVFVFLSGQAVYSEETTSAKKIVLPQVPDQGSISLEEALWKRESVRAFRADTPSWEQIGRLLWAAQGITRPDSKKRTAPSAGAFYPLELYVVLSDGVYHYLPLEHAVETIREGNAWEKLSQAGLKKSAVYESPCVFLLLADFERATSKFRDQATRYIYLEAGHAAQNLLLQATVLGLGCVPVGVALDAKTGEALEIPGSLKPVYVIATGFPQAK